VHRCGTSAALVGTPQRLAVDRDDTAEIQPIEVGERRHEAAERLLESLRVEDAKDAAERIVTGNAVLQAQEPPQQQLLGTAETLHIRGTLGPAQHGGQSDEQDVQQIVACVVRPRIAQPSENLPEFAHVTPLANRESPSESTFVANATLALKSYAIPLPSRGR